MSDELFSVTGKTVLVTGGSRGIGYMIAQGMAARGARVIISSRKADACAQAQRALAEFGDVTAIPADVADPDAATGLIAQVEERFGELHVLINNAGAAWGAPFDEFPLHGWSKVLGVNVVAPFVLVQRARALLEASGSQDDPARVINIGSIDGLRVPEFDNFSYSASKAGIHMLTRHMAHELAPRILVNAIAPGPFPTQMLGGAIAENGGEEAARERNPLGRFGTPDDATGMTVFLASRASSYITGAIIPLDGGASTIA
ncbi:SDR family oxidoreductase [Brevibacterium sp. BRM-1]|uniref:SDR family oxidoreductase n=1 Tax=Brevibacterium sp. BRM-1 TaxID=2999062 RepID=UPI0022812C92|nr:SDR family oxidoreductase [Brevibacterium sp. BRM-1]WAL39644.1 SDR family oxidoreductase [Brevibacterium sp. BRM-1]